MSKPAIPWTRMLKIASRTRSEVGRVARPDGAKRLRPLSFPPTIRILCPARELQARLIGDHLGRNLVNTAGLEVAQLERPEGRADQPVDPESQMLAHPLDL